MKKLFIILLIPIFGFTQIQIGDAIQGVRGDLLGNSVSLSSDGNIIAIGAPQGELADYYRMGFVRIYENEDGIWTQVGGDINGENIMDEFGRAVSLSSDGNIVAIGAPFNNNVNGIDAGHVRVFENVDNVWTQIGQDIDGEDGSDPGFPGDNSGWSVSLSDDGNIVAIGAPHNNGNGGYAGHVRVYENIDGVWTQIGEDIDSEAAFDRASITSISANGRIVAIGAPRNDDNGFDSGHVRVYENIDSVWTQIGQDIDGESIRDSAGRGLSLSSSGNIIAIGANHGEGGDYSGHVHIYENLAGVWTQIGQSIEGEVPGDYVGWNLSLSSDGNIIALGGYTSSGIYKNIGDVWTPIANDLINFGFVSLSLDGTVVASGSPYNSENGEESGQVIVYDLSSILSTEEVEITEFGIHPNPAKNEFTIQLDDNSKLIKVNIYNNLGQLIHTTRKSTIATSKFSTGIYSVVLTTNKGKASKKLVIE